MVVNLGTSISALIKAADGITRKGNVILERVKASY